MKDREGNGGKQPPDPLAMEKRRALLQTRRSKYTRRQRRRQWMVRIVLTGLILMLAISITLTLWPPLPEVASTNGSPTPEGRPTIHSTTVPLEFPSTSPPPGLKLEPESPGLPPSGVPSSDPNFNLFQPGAEFPPEFFDDLHLGVWKDYGWQPPPPPGMEGMSPEGMDGPPEEMMGPPE